MDRHRGMWWRWERARGRLTPFETNHEHFSVTTDDGVAIAGTRLGSGDTAIVLAHGFMGHRFKTPWRVLAQGLAREFTVYTFDMRGHGHSTGVCEGGVAEANDVAAVVEHARARGHAAVVTVGGSMGGVAVITHAANTRGSDGVVAISTAAVWGGTAPHMPMVKRTTWLIFTRSGRFVSRHVMGTRIHRTWSDPAPPSEVVGKIAPVPLLIVHGEDDHFFPGADAQMLFERASEPKRLLMLPKFGHAEDGFTPAFAAMLAGEIEKMLARAI